MENNIPNNYRCIKMKILLILMIFLPTLSVAETTQSKDSEAADKENDVSSELTLVPNSEAQMLLDYSKSDFRDPYDRWPDITGWLVNNLYGFVPIPIIITEPAVGYGGGLSLLFVSPKKPRFKTPPNLYAVAGAYTKRHLWVRRWISR